MSHGARTTEIVSTADWLLGLADRARRAGEQQRADHLLLRAWMAYDGQDCRPIACESVGKRASEPREITAQA